MAAMHTQDEWENLYDKKLLKPELEKKCKTKIKDKYIPDLFDFLYEYAEDSGNVPSC